MPDNRRERRKFSYANRADNRTRSLASHAATIVLFLGGNGSEGLTPEPYKLLGTVDTEPTRNGMIYEKSAKDKSSFFCIKCIIVVLNEKSTIIAIVD